MDWNAAWIWHPATEDPDNFCMYARKELSLSRPCRPTGPMPAVAASTRPGGPPPVCRRV